MKMNKKIRVGLVAALSLSLVLTGCASEDPNTAPSATNSAAVVPEHKQDDQLRALLPQEILDKGSLVAVNSGSFPPYEIIGQDGSHTGASADLMAEVAKLWGIEITSKTVDGLSSILTGMAADRYQMAFGPVGDFKSRQVENDFIDWVQEFVVFAVVQGNPKGINSIEDVCGLRISVQGGGSAEKVVNTQSDKCVAEGKPAVEVQSYKDQPQSILAVQSGRADGFFSSRAPLTYFVEQSNGALELAGTESSNNFDKLYQGALVKKDAQLGVALLATMEQLFEDGTYEAIMTKWGLEANMIDAPGKNLGVS